MKTLTAVIILIFSFQSLTKADDIRDFQIEGMSLYKSALDYFSKSEIKKAGQISYKDKKYITSNMKSSNFETYQVVQISYKSDDKKLILLDICGIVDKDYQKCLKEIKSIEKDFELMFPNTKKFDLETYSHWQDKSGESKISDIIWKFDNGDVIVLACYNWNTAYGKKKRYNDELRIAIGSKEFDSFLVGLN